jgi:hypothetical protein
MPLSDVSLRPREPLAHLGQKLFACGLDSVGLGLSLVKEKKAASHTHSECVDSIPTVADAVAYSDASLITSASLTYAN